MAHGQRHGILSVLRLQKLERVVPEKLLDQLPVDPDILGNQNGCRLEEDRVGEHCFIRFGNHFEGRRLHIRQDDLEDGAGIYRASDRDMAAHHFGKTAGYRQPQAGPAIFGVALTLLLLEGVKDPSGLAFGDTDPRILHR